LHTIVNERSVTIHIFLPPPPLFVNIFLMLRIIMAETTIYVEKS